MPRSHKPELISKGYNNLYGNSIKTGTNGHCPLSPSGAHQWRLDPPGSEVSEGRCLHCGTTRTFYNTIDAALNDGAGRYAIGRAM